jgi:hypothetical protein
MTTVNVRLRPVMVVVDGQSLAILPGPAASFSGHLFPTLANTAVMPGYVVAIGSTAYSELAQTEVTRAFRHATAAPLTMWLGIGGTSDVLNGDVAATIYATIKTYAVNAKAAGFTKTIITTITPSGGFTAGQNTQRKAANDLLITNADAAFDAVVDLACDSTLSNPGAPPSGTTFYGTGHLANPADLTYYQGDQLHWNSAGCGDAAGSSRPAVVALGGS